MLDVIEVCDWLLTVVMSLCRHALVQSERSASNYKLVVTLGGCGAVDVFFIL